MFKRLIRKLYQIRVAPYEIQEISKTQKKILEKLDDISYRNDLFFYELYRREGETITDAKKRLLHSFKFENENVQTIQEGNRILVKHFADICAKNNIKYSMWVGSALGAYIHKGFIPWDDDVDVAILQDDFIKLKNVLAHYPKFTILEHVRSDTYDLIYNFVFKDYTCIFCIDLFVFSPTNIDLNKALEIKAKKRSEIRNLIQKDKKIKNFFSGQKLNPNIYNRKDYPDLFRYFKNVDFNPFMDNNSKQEITGYICNINMNDMRAYKKDIVIPLKTLKFENIDVLVPNKIEEYLKIRYGYIYNLPNNFQKNMHYITDKKSLDLKKEREFLKKINEEDSITNKGY